MSSRLLLLDSASMYFRAFYGVKGDVTSPRGEPVGAIRGFLDAVATLISTRNPNRVVACWDDDWRPAFRVAALPSYKEHRLASDSDATAGAEEAPAELGPQVPVIADLLAAIGIARVGAPGCEADDVIGTLATRAVAAGEVEAVEIVTGDRDLFQLVDDPATGQSHTSVRVLYTGRGMRNLEVVDTARLGEKYGVASGLGYEEMSILRGDASDGLPGVKGVGEKTAAGLLASYGSLAAAQAAAEAEDARMPASLRSKLTAAEDYIERARIVVRVLRDAPLPDIDDRLDGAPRDPDALADLAARWGVASSVERVTAAIATAAG